MGFATLLRQTRLQVDGSGCIEFTGAKTDGGYGRVWTGSRTDGTGKVVPAHRAAYEHYRGPIPDGLDLDHLCRNRACVRPDHLEPVTRAENLRRGDGPRLSRERQLAKTHCPHGHEYDEANTYYYPSGSRKCRTCHRVAEQVRRDHKENN